MPRNTFTNKYLRFNEESEKYLALRKAFRKATGGKRWKPGVLNRLGSAASQKARDIEAAIVAQRDVLNTVMAKKQKETDETMKNQTLSVECESHKVLKSSEVGSNEDVTEENKVMSKYSKNGVYRGGNKSRQRRNNKKLLKLLKKKQEALKQDITVNEPEKVTRTGEVESDKKSSAEVDNESGMESSSARDVRSAASSADNESCVDRVGPGGEWEGTVMCENIVNHGSCSNLGSCSSAHSVQELHHNRLEKVSEENIFHLYSHGSVQGTLLQEITVSELHSDERRVSLCRVLYVRSWFPGVAQHHCDMLKL